MESNVTPNIIRSSDSSTTVPPIVNWFVNFFCPRQQFTVYNDVISSVLGVDFGVAQGSIVGPLIFFVFMNGIVNSCSLAKFVIYANDTNFFISSSNLGQLYNSMNEELILVNSWL